MCAETYLILRCSYVRVLGQLISPRASQHVFKICFVLRNKSIKNLLTISNQLKVQLNIFDKQVSPSCWLFWAALHQGAVSYASLCNSQIYYKTSVGSLVGIEHITFESQYDIMNGSFHNVFHILYSWPIINFQVNASSQSFLITFGCSHSGRWPFISQNIHGFQQHNVTNNKISSSGILFLTLLQWFQVFLLPAKSELVGYMR